MKKTKASASFNVDDIHKIRVSHYKKIKNLSKQEKIDWYNDKAEKVLKKDFLNAKIKYI